ncbi:Hypothetical protein GbCGDNIH1_1701a [Granulibacter bethesdensis CGDNIH1]|uniref:Uncharacterized protein n=1 Tax=Granulibacter bethesdensis (strain ATCC BAA-1260 / CGDNIH1) TaxID=391165 RepID=A0A286M357_GRABC|nr:Hypothetical protein GbCGDNIH1I4_1701 [Granulibacter bethesdensis]ASV62456.1 Hypothetical protein GbCGDNIH1_1701a [Granulibacter bethesdensis CGDNIH1]
MAIGLSPRTRRNPEKQRRPPQREWSISAHAEEPKSMRSRPRISRVYLRARGGTTLAFDAASVRTGLSPRTRRNQQALSLTMSAARSISAHAEEPVYGVAGANVWGVYLRARGGTAQCAVSRSGSHGLSPRTRRNREMRAAEADETRSISAHAEEP